MDIEKDRTVQNYSHTFNEKSVQGEHYRQRKRNYIVIIEQMLRLWQVG